MAAIQITFNSIPLTALNSPQQFHLSQQFSRTLHLQWYNHEDSTTRHWSPTGDLHSLAPAIDHHGSRKSSTTNSNSASAGSSAHHSSASIVQQAICHLSSFWINATVNTIYMYYCFWHVCQQYNVIPRLPVPILQLKVHEAGKYIKQQESWEGSLAKAQWESSHLHLQCTFECQRKNDSTLTQNHQVNWCSVIYTSTYHVYYR